MAIAFVKTLLEGRASSSIATALVLSGSKTVSAGNSIVLAVGGAPNAATVTDNLGNTYEQIVTCQDNGFSALARLYRAVVTNPGTLTTITFSVAPFTIGATGAIAVEFSGLGAVIDSKGVRPASQSSFVNAYPGGASSASAAYAANTLWVGSFFHASINTFVGYAGGGQYVSAVEPTPEQKISGGGGDVCVGLLYYLSASAKNPATLLGQFQDSQNNAGAGVVFAVGPTGVIYNDTCSGSIVFTGSRTESWQRGIVNSDAPTGPLALGGSAVEYIGKGFTDARSGTLALAGSRVEQRGRYGSPTGSAALNGTATEVWFIKTGYYDAPAGAIGIAGTSAPPSRRYTDLPSGRVTILGATTERNIRSKAVTGRIQTYGWAARTLPSGTPQPIGIPGPVAQSGVPVVNPTVLRVEPGSGFALGDVLICLAVGGSGAALNLTSSPPTPGWTIGRPPAGGGGVYTAPLYLLGKVVESLDEPPLVLTFNTVPGSSGSPVMARIVAFRGLDTSDMTQIADVVGDYNALSSVGQTAGGAGITTVYDNDLVLSLTRRYPNVVTNRLIPPAGFGMVTWDNVDSGERMVAGWAYQTKKPAGVVAAPLFGVSTTDPTSYTSDGVTLALKALSADEHFSTPSGRLAFTGSAVERKVYPDTPQGRIAVAGAVTAESHAHRPQITGRLAFSGTVVESNRRVSACAGSIALSGTAVEKRVYVESVSGTLPVTGASTDFYKRNKYDVCSGVLKLAGVLSQTLVIHDDADGLLRLSGRNSEFIEIDDAIFYDDFTTGLITIDGRVVFVDYTPEPGRNGRIVVAYEPGRIVRSLQPGRVVGNLTGRVT